VYIYWTFDKILAFLTRGSSTACGAWRIKSTRRLAALPCSTSDWEALRNKRQNFVKNPDFMTRREVI